MTKVVICGALGRMGTTIAGLLQDADGLEFVGGVDIKGGESFGKPVVTAAEIDAFLERVQPDVMIDFTIASAAVENIRAATRHGVALVVGTTGFSPAQMEEVTAAIEGSVPAVISSNFSVGMNIFWKLVREAARRLGDYDIEVIEAHHRYKKDAPSGTAKTILNIIEEEAGVREKLYGREGITERADEIGVHVVRGGDIVGDHTVLFAANHETIELSHRAYDRAVFAHGVIRAAQYVGGKAPGIYSMDDVLSL
ncbi:4-hydroxy-tetrahydrodipicolinate reductase [Methanomicrobiaceae archaeon CYW5]|uniref:4-hydroxy-tetrahydrodipicolinate reductase n=1 Tax=Methanovulcanius yangii TaxID=1789227 RepID=UPI0029CA6862|nr:4-hydroxy-tetrahydrodipicolinate reductase [Methanovulcanius yangii]MBT8507701.1 4-hydroxy-tetrahydrodipicolinate reductase [Methanovulcanius yangii]